MSERPYIGESVRDALLVARFEILRAVRTWQAVAVIALFVIASGGATYLFVEVLAEIETEIARQLHVPPTDRPGAMMDALAQGDDVRRIVRGLVGGDATLVEPVLAWPLVSVFHLWTSLLFVPYLAAFASAEAISGDVATRAIRFELLRTGRLELVLGRFVGHVVLLVESLLLAAFASFLVAWWTMVLPRPFELWLALLVMAARACAWGLPFLGLGLFCSQITRSPTWARVLALVATTLVWFLWGLTRWAAYEGYAAWVAPLSSLLPPAWIRSLWEGGPHAVVAALYLGALAVVLVAAGHAILARRDT